MHQTDYPVTIISYNIIIIDLSFHSKSKPLKRAAVQGIDWSVD